MGWLKAKANIIKMEQKLEKTEFSDFWNLIELLS